MALSCGMSCIKYLLFAFNVLFALTGLVLIVVGANAQINAHPYTDLADEGFYKAVPVVLIVVGVVVFVVAFFGCCGAIKEHHCMIITFSVLIGLIFVTELAVGIAAYVKRGDLEQSVKTHLNSSIDHYYTDNSVRSTFDIMQTDLKCCGVNEPADWIRHALPVPASCCSEQAVVDGVALACTMQSPQLYRSGCVPALVAHMNKIKYVLGGVGLGIAIIQLLGVIFACVLARSIRSQYETV